MHRAATLYSVGLRKTRTMKQSLASAAKLRGGGPILATVITPCAWSGHRHLEFVHAGGAAANRQYPAVCSVQLIGRNATPAGISPMVTNRQSAMSNLRANATIIVVLRAPWAVRARNHCTSSLSFWNLKKRQAS